MNRLRRHVVRLAPTGIEVWRRGANSFAVVDVIDDDTTPAVQVRAKNDRVVEGGRAVFELTRAGGDLRRGLRINYRYTDPDGTTVVEEAEFPPDGTTVEVSYATTDDSEINTESPTHTVSLHGDLHVGGTNIDRSGGGDSLVCNGDGQRQRPARGHSSGCIGAVASPPRNRVRPGVHGDQQWDSSGPGANQHRCRLLRVPCDCLYARR